MKLLASALAALKGALPPGSHPKVGVILGSGLGAFADTLERRVALPFSVVPELPRSTVVGHAGEIVHGTCAGVEVLAFKGRVHHYEGHGLDVVALPARLLIASGCGTLIVTNVAGGVDAALRPGQIVIIADHLNLLGGSPLRGPHDDALGPRFVDLSEAYSRRLRELASAAGADLGMALREGIYAALPGPHYETPAEIRMLRLLGADLVGMSTVPEVIAARQLGAEVLGLSLCSNLAAGVSLKPLSHEEVTATAARTRDGVVALLTQIVKRLAGQLAGER